MKRLTKKDRKKQVTLLIIIAFLVLIIGLVIYVGQVFYEVDKYKNNNFLQANSSLSSVVNIKYGKKNFEIYESEMSANNSSFLFNTPLSRFSFFDKLNYLKMLEGKGFSKENALKNTFPGLESKVNNIAKEIFFPGEDATIKLASNKKSFYATKEKNKIELDKTKVYENIFNDLFLKGFSTFDAPVVKTSPEFTQKFLNDNLTARSSFTTSFAGGQSERAANIALALKKFNGKILEPGQTFSFNKITSPHTNAGGYLNAKIIVNGEFVDGAAGGVCQASTTVYNACLLAGLKIKEAHSHSLPVGYVKLPFDAMVSASSDLIVENNFDFPVGILSWTDEYEAHVQIISLPFEPGERIERISILVKEIVSTERKEIKYDNERHASLSFDADNRAVFKNAASGFEYEGYLQYYKNDALVRTVKVRHSIFKPQPEIVVIRDNL